LSAGRLGPFQLAALPGPAALLTTCTTSLLCPASDRLARPRIVIGRSMEPALAAGGNRCTNNDFSRFGGGGKASEGADILALPAAGAHGCVQGLRLPLR
jgi:hypothetical protein